MKKTFNVAGPCHPNEHYMLPTQERCQGLLQLIEQKLIFRYSCSPPIRQNHALARTHKAIKRNRGLLCFVLFVGNGSGN